MVLLYHGLRNKSDFSRGRTYATCVYVSRWHLTMCMFFNLQSSALGRGPSRIRGSVLNPRLTRFNYGGATLYVSTVYCVACTDTPYGIQCRDDPRVGPSRPARGIDGAAYVVHSTMETSRPPLLELI
ncbi:hypothetical protein P152DRAFT_37655 [Eremomyces bilateralis CBS 781.70]|uniref:Uncharacterized protein n=1 Tax=Eremomyces bilateralis CBS 781.70 TaxID=1392243 RepID=A0A6G1G286_9PEZI|nr:uncharacterized protein P152DRAFT_37655 [Eremomyces bilateralis CBS 781.70]KAF1811919.1 hypothetical protein P152DRAFT_37655 [Eremomyces bilateralis CBS 781.70]